MVHNWPQDTEPDNEAKASTPLVRFLPTQLVQDLQRLA